MLSGTGSGLSRMDAGALGFAGAEGGAEPKSSASSLSAPGGRRDLLGTFEFFGGFFPVRKSLGEPGDVHQSCLSQRIEDPIQSPEIGRVQSIDQQYHSVTYALDFLDRINDRLRPGRYRMAHRPRFFLLRSR